MKKKCKKCQGTGRIRPNQPCYYNCELGGDCPDITPLHCALYGTIPCDCGIKPSNTRYFNEFKKKIVKVKL